MLPLTGYADRLSVRPGETIRFHLTNATGAKVEAKLVRVICADANPAGPGILVEPVASAPVACGAAGEERSPRWARMPASRIRGAASGRGSFSVTCLVHPTRLAGARQAIVSRTGDAARSGFALAIDEQGRLCASIGDGTSMRDVAVGPESARRAGMACRVARGGTPMPPKSASGGRRRRPDSGRRFRRGPQARRSPPAHLPRRTPRCCLRP